MFDSLQISDTRCRRLGVTDAPSPPAPSIHNHHTTRQPRGHPARVPRVWARVAHDDAAPGAGAVRQRSRDHSGDRLSHVRR